MNVQPKLSTDDCTMPAAPAAPFGAEPHPPAHRVPAGPRLPLTWPVEFEVEPWRP
jgi:hypothetical protein